MAQLIQFKRNVATTYSTESAAKAGVVSKIKAGTITLELGEPIVISYTTGDVGRGADSLVFGVGTGNNTNPVQWFASFEDFYAVYEQSTATKNTLDDLYSGEVALDSNKTSNALFSKIQINGKTYVRANYDFYSVGEITAGGVGELPGGSSGSSSGGALYLLADVASSASGDKVGQSVGGAAAEKGMLLAYDGTHWVAISPSEISTDTSEIEADIDELQQQVVALNTALSTKANASDLNSLTERVEDNEGDISTLQGEVAGLTQNSATKAELKGVSDKVDTLIDGDANKSVRDIVSEVTEDIITTQKGVADGLASLGSDGKVPSSQLPSYVDDVVEYDSRNNFPTTGESGKIYVATDTNLTYRWSGSSYVEISQSIALGETSSTAYAGDKGKANADAIAKLNGDVNTDGSVLNTIKEQIDGIAANDETSTDGNNVQVKVTTQGGGVTAVNITTDDTANKSRKVSAGDGLTGGGDLTADRTIALGTPSTITDDTTNTVTETSHTHAIDEASTTKRGIVKLVSTVSATSTDETTALTPKAGATLQGNINTLGEKKITAGAGLNGDITLKSGGTMSVNVDNSSIVIDNDSLAVSRIDGGTF